MRLELLRDIARPTLPNGLAGSPLPVSFFQVVPRGGVDDVGVGGVDHDAPDAARQVEAQVLPGLAGVGGLVHPVADRDMAADPRLTRPRPHDVRVRWSDGEGADRLHRLVVEDRLPVDAAVRRLPHATRRGARVIRAGVADDARDRRDPVAHRPDVAVAQLAERGGIDLRGRGRGGCRLPRRPGRPTAALSVKPERKKSGDEDNANHDARHGEGLFEWRYKETARRRDWQCACGDAVLLTRHSASCYAGWVAKAPRNASKTRSDHQPRQRATDSSARACESPGWCARVVVSAS